mgnify:CR=1 FL=1
MVCLDTHNPTLWTGSIPVYHFECQPLTALRLGKEERNMRKDMITRTVIGTQVSVKVVNTTTEAISTETVVLNKAFTDINDTKLVKAVKKVLAEDLVIIKVESLIPLNKLYGLDTSVFMQYAVELDPVTRKPLN